MSTKFLDFGTRLHFEPILASFWAHLASFWAHFGSILAPFWLHFSYILVMFWLHLGLSLFALILAPFLAPFWASRASRLGAILVQKTIKNRWFFLSVFRCIFHWFWEPKCIPKPSQKACKNQPKNQSKNRHIFFIDFSSNSVWIFKVFLSIF